MKQKPGLKCVGGTAVADKSASAASLDGKNVTLPALLQKVRNHALEDLHQMLGLMFSQADDLFFEYASKAGDAQSQDASIEVMREFRLKRKEFEKSFFSAIAKDFKAIAAGSNGARPPLESIGGLDGLSLMETDEVEESVAVEAMVNKARDAFSTTLYHLHTRLDALAIHAAVDKSNNPLDPKQLCDAFKQATQVVQCEIKYRLIFFKLFQRHVLDNYDRVIDNANYHLAQAGVLPDLKGTPHKLRKASLSKRTASSSDTGGQHRSQPAGRNTGTQQVPVNSGAAAANEFFSQLQALLASVRTVSDSFGPAGGPIGSVSSQANVVAPNELIQILSNMQQAQPRGEAYLNGESLAKINIRNTLSNILKQQEAKAGPQRVDQTETDVINLVSMLFDFILDDDNLPDRVKALIGRLQIPMVKVAIADRSFLNRGGHPARKLLNELARAGIGLNDQTDQIKNDMVFKKISETVQKILDEFANDLNVFTQALAEFTGFMQQEVRRAEMIEHRTKAAEEGRVRAEVAKREVAKALESKVDGKYLPTVVAKIIDGPWSNYLNLIYLKQGKESKHFAAALRTIDHLIASVSKVEDEAEKKRLFTIVPSLLKNLRAGFKTISYNPFETGEMLNELERIQMQVLRGEKPDYLEDLDGHESRPEDKLLEAVAKDMGDAANKALSGTCDQSPIVQHTDKLARLDISRKIQADEKHELPELPENDQHLVAAKQLQVGSWLEMYMDEQKVRCKLAAHIKSVDKMIFVNRSGMKVMEKTMLEVAHDIKAEKLTVLDDSLLFDRALENVISNLRNIREKS